MHQMQEEGAPNNDASVYKNHTGFAGPPSRARIVMSFLRACRAWSTVAAAGAATAALAYQEGQHRGGRRARCDSAPAAGVEMSKELPELVKQAEEERKRAARLKNPGTFDKLFEEGKRISTIDAFEGFRLDITKMVTPRFYVSHSFMLGAKMPHVETNALYDFSTHVILPGNQLLLARLGHGGSIDGRYHFALGENTLVKLVASMQPNPAKDAFQVEGEQHGPDHSATVRLTRGPQQALFASYMQSITPALALGGETMYDLGEGAGVFSLGGKYAGRDWTGALMLAQFGQICLLQYVKHVSPGRMTLVADLTLNPLTLDSQTVLGAEVNMKQSRFLTTVDNGGKLATLLESRVVPNAVTLILSAEIDHAKSEYRTGYGFQLNL